MNDSSLFWLRVARRLSAAATLDEVVERPHHEEVHGGAHAGDAQLRERESSSINGYKYKLQTLLAMGMQ